MKNFKRIIAMALVLLMVLSFAGCHKKGEIAVTVGEVEFTSAYYMCALVNADSEAKSKVYEELDEEEQSAEIDFYSKKIDDSLHIIAEAISYRNESQEYSQRCHVPQYTKGRVF